VPAGTSKGVIDRLNGGIEKALDLPEVATKLNNLSLDPVFMIRDSSRCPASPIRTGTPDSTS
jgi:tripartite-type tricarboxylate transporter receptor subunit TctC